MRARTKYSGSRVNGRTHRGGQSEKLTNVDFDRDFDQPWASMSPQGRTSGNPGIVISKDQKKMRIVNTSRRRENESSALTLDNCTFEEGTS